MPFKKELARSSQRDNITNQLKKWGNTPYMVEHVDIELEDEWFVPSSLLSDMRRALCDLLLNEAKAANERADMRLKNTDTVYVTESLDYRGNVANALVEELENADME